MQDYSLFEKHKVIYDSQLGFQKGKLTNHSLIEITEKIRNCMEKKIMVVVFLLI